MRNKFKDVMMFDQGYWVDATKHNAQEARDLAEEYDKFVSHEEIDYEFDDVYPYSGEFEYGWSGDDLLAVGREGKSKLTDIKKYHLFLY